MQSGRPTANEEATPSTQYALKVEAFGSGAVIVPCFPFNETTSTSELFDVVRATVALETCYDACFVRLILVEKVCLLL